MSCTKNKPKTETKIICETKITLVVTSGALSCLLAMVLCMAIITTPYADSYGVREGTYAEKHEITSRGNKIENFFCVSLRWLRRFGHGRNHWWGRQAKIWMDPLNFYVAFWWGSGGGNRLRQAGYTFLFFSGEGQ